MEMGFQKRCELCDRVFEKGQQRYCHLFSTEPHMRIVCKECNLSIVAQGTLSKKDFESYITWCDKIEQEFNNG